MELIQVNRAGILDAAGGIWCRTPSHPGRVLLHRMGGCLFGRVARSAVMSCGPSHRGRCSYIERGAASLGVAPTRVMSCPGLSHRDGAPTLNGAATLVRSEEHTSELQSR